MVRLFKKWRLVRRLRKECLSHIGKQGDGFVSREGTVWVSKGAFAEQTGEHIWRARFWSEAHKTENLHQIHSILDSCIAEKFVDFFQHDDGRKFMKTSLTGEDFCGFTDFLESFLSKYRSVATILIIPIVTFVLGFFGQSILKKLTEKPPQRADQASKTAEVSEPPTTQEQSSKGQDTRTGPTERRVTHKEPKPGAPSTSPSPIRQDCGGGNCAVSVGQKGGITAGVLNLGPPPLKLEYSVHTVLGDEKPTFGFDRSKCPDITHLRIVPNQSVPPPVRVALDFDHPIKEIATTIEGVGAVMGGGPFTVGSHAVSSPISPGIGPHNPLIVEVCSDTAVNLTGEPRLVN
jgi:hypothetical protein